jgi:anion-transporting  ArsA/GET3 family ATPase
MFAARGRRTLAIEMDVSGRLPAVLGAPTAAVGTAREVSPNLSVVSIDGRAALEEYLGLVIPVKRLLSTIFSSRVYQYFVAAAPGLKELMTVGKVWYEATRKDGARMTWDTVVVDAPATGHGLQYLRMPQAARDTFGAGLVQREATRVVDLLQDARTTAVHLVTLAEDMPVTEALEAHAQITGPLGLPAGAVIVNRVHRGRFALDLVAALEAAAAAATGGERTILGAVAERAIEETSWADINVLHLEHLRSALGAAPIELPYLFAEEFGEDELATLTRLLDEAAALPAARSA